MIITHGLSGSGKSTFIKQLAPRYGAVTLHSDIERKRLHGLAATDQSQSAADNGIYTEQANQKTYTRLQKLAELAIKSGFPVIVDATFLKQHQRDQMLQLASRLTVPFVILDFPLSETELFRRVELRSKKSGQISEADSNILRHQLDKQQPLSPEEERICIKVSPESSPQEIADQID